jgi:hypothetical protein
MYAPPSVSRLNGSSLGSYLRVYVYTSKPPGPSLEAPQQINAVVGEIQEICRMDAGSSNVSLPSSRHEVVDNKAIDPLLIRRHENIQTNRNEFL